METEKYDFSKGNSLKNSISNYDFYCDGYGNNHKNGNGYVLGLVLSVAKVKQQFSHLGSNTLDYINAFDKAEVAETNIGKINMTTVSSFCGPNGLILGYDILASKDLEKHRLNLRKHADLNIYSLEPLLLSTKALLGTIDKPVFPIIPGAHIPCAGKHIEAVGPVTLYAAVALGISENGHLNYTLLMEDAGLIDDSPEEEIINNLVGSVIEVGCNQKTKYKTIFVGMKKIHVEQGMVGCALISAPYLLLPSKAIGASSDEFIKLSLESWIENIKSLLK